MKLTNPSLTKLSVCLKDELGAMTFLANVLIREQAALIDGNVEKLNELTQEKSQLLTSLSQFEKERNLCLIHFGYSPDMKGMQDYLSQAETCAADSQAWDDLIQISKNAKENNRTNGLLINRQITRNHGALNILQHNTSAGNMYGPTGQSTNQVSSIRGVVIG
jgi:flagella synthesis protein FlgN